MTAIWWLSFCDPERPAGARFLGACMVRASHITEAVQVAHALGVNPGGEVAALEVPAARAVPDHWLERLLSRAECEMFDAEMRERLGQGAR